MKTYLIKFIFPLLFLLTSVSPLYYFDEDYILLVITLLVSVMVIYRGQRLNYILWLVLGYWLLVNLYAFVVFGDRISDLAYTLLGSVVRLLLAFMLVKYVGYNLFDYSERIIFILLLIGLPIYFLTESFPAINNFFRFFDLGSVAKQAEKGGWNILVFNHNAWASFRFSGFAWEPGACALMIIFGLIISILRDGLVFDKRKAFYILCLIFTLSTAGYLAFGALMVIYSYELGKKGFVYMLLFIVIFIPLAIYAYKLDCISEEINTYVERAEERAEEGFSDDEYSRISRIDYVYLGSELVSKWPFGYGVSEKGRPKSNRGTTLKGSNALIEVIVKWGIFGFIVLIYSYHKLFKYFSIIYRNKSYRFLYIPLMIMFFSNAVDRYPIFIGPFFYLFLCKKELLFSVKTVKKSINY